MKFDIKRLQDALGYCFDDSDLLKQALTHRSAGSKNNERLEFLGDSVLGVIISTELYQRYPKASEGDLSRMRASLVKGAALAKIASVVRLGEYLILGSGELKSGGFRRESILAGALEAIIGAVYMEAGTEACRALILNLWRDALAVVTPETVQKDPKTRLQELMQALKRPLPIYNLEDVGGEAHAQAFTVTCVVEGLNAATRGVGNSRRAAEQDAAAKALVALSN